MAKPKKWNEMSAAEQATENEARAAGKATRMAAEKAALAAESEKVGRPAEKGKSKLAKAAKVSRPTVDVNAKALGPKQSAGTTVPVEAPVKTPNLGEALRAGQAQKVKTVKSPTPPAAKAVAKAVESPTLPAAKVVAKAVAAPEAAIYPPKMQIGDLFQSVSHARGPMIDADIGLQTGALSAKQRIGRTAGSVVAKGLKWGGTPVGKQIAKGITAVSEAAIGPIMNPIRGFRAGSVARAASWKAAGPIGKAAQTVATGAKLGFAGTKIAGGIARGIGYGIATDMALEFADHYPDVKVEREFEAMNRAEYGREHGLEVTSAPPSLLRMVTGGSPKIKVHDTTQDVGPDGKSLSQKRRERGQAKFDENARKLN